MYLKILLKLCCFGFSSGFFPEQEKRSTVKKPARLRSLRANFFKKASFLLFSLKEIKLINDSFELSVSICVLKQCTMHLTLHREATQQKSSQ